MPSFSRLLLCMYKKKNVLLCTCIHLYLYQCITSRTIFLNLPVKNRTNFDTKITRTLICMIHTGCAIFFFLGKITVLFLRYNIFTWFSLLEFIWTIFRIEVQAIGHLYCLQKFFFLITLMISAQMLALSSLMVRGLCLVYILLFN